MSFSEKDSGDKAVPENRHNWRYYRSTTTHSLELSMPFFRYKGIKTNLVLLLITTSGAVSCTLGDPQPQCQGLENITVERATYIGLENAYSGVGTRIGYNSFDEFISSPNVNFRTIKVDKWVRHIEVHQARGSFMVIVSYLDYPNPNNTHTSTSYVLIDACGIKTRRGGV